MMRGSHSMFWRVATTAVFGSLAVGAALYGQGSTPSPQPARPAYLTAVQPAPGGPMDATLREADALVRRGLNREAEDLTRLYLREHPHSADGHFMLGLILFRETKATESLAEYTAGAEERRPSAYDLKIVGLDYGILKDFMSAAKWLTMSLKESPKDSEGWYYLGRVKYNSNYFKEAIDAFQKCLELDPRNVKAEDNLGLSYEGSDNAEAALNAYGQAIEWQAQAAVKDPGPWINAGSLYVEKERFAEAIPLLKTAISIAPNEFKAHHQLGKAYLRLDQLPLAQRELEQAVAISPNNAPLHFVLGQIYRRQGLVEKANAEYRRCTELNGTHSTKNVPAR